MAVFIGFHGFERVPNVPTSKLEEARAATCQSRHFSL
jgi:hypothetical protein